MTSKGIAVALFAGAVCALMFFASDRLFKNRTNRVVRFFAEAFCLLFALVLLWSGEQFVIGFPPKYYHYITFIATDCVLNSLFVKLRPRFNRLIQTQKRKRRQG